jgi:hypothetical protein
LRLKLTRAGIAATAANTSASSVGSEGELMARTKVAHAEYVVAAASQRGVDLVNVPVNDTPRTSVSEHLLLRTKEWGVGSAMLTYWGWDNKPWRVSVITRRFKNGKLRSRDLGKWVHLEPALDRLKQYAG